MLLAKKAGYEHQDAEGFLSWWLIMPNQDAVGIPIVPFLRPDAVVARVEPNSKPQLAVYLRILASFSVHAYFSLTILRTHTSIRSPTLLFKHVNLIC